MDRKPDQPPASRARIEGLFRPSLEYFQAYSSARSLGLTARVYLDANELSFGSAIDSEGESLNRYPDPECAELRADLSRWVGVKEENLFLCSGSDQGIDLLIRLFCEPFEDEIAILEPTYGMYKTAAELQGVRVRRLKLNARFDLSAKQILPHLKGTKAVFLCSPNNPTGNLLDPDEVLSLLQNYPGLVIIDQAYLEFCLERPGADWSHRVPEFANLVVLRTFSKAWGLAAIRLGYVIAQRPVIEGLKRVMPPYPVSTVTARIGQKALERTDFLAESVHRVRRERERMILALAKSPLVVSILPSETNFLLVRFRDRDFVFERLLERGLCMRRRSEPELFDCLRLTIGTIEQNSAVLDVLDEIAIPSEPTPAEAP